VTFQLWSATFRTTSSEKFNPSITTIRDNKNHYMLKYASSMKVLTTLVWEYPPYTLILSTQNGVVHESSSLEEVFPQSKHFVLHS